MTKLNLWTEARNECVEQLFSETMPANGACKTAIIGGGISGILVALRLSRVMRIGETLSLFEQSATLGGRLFFSIPQNTPTESSPAEAFLKRLTACRAGEASGFGFEALGSEAAIALERHIRSSLDESESAFLDAFLSEAASSPEELQRPARTYFVRKELIPFENTLRESTDLLTKKEAELLSGLLSIDTQISEPEKLTLQETQQWKSLSNSQKDALTSILETLVTRGVLDFGASTAKHHFQNKIAETSTTSHPPFRRTVAFELACELILRARGVRIYTGCRVTKLTSPGNHDFVVTCANAPLRQEHKVEAHNVVIAAPLISCMPFLPREFLSGSQSKCILKYPPSSLVVAEYFDFKNFQNADLCKNLNAGDKLLFATDRVQGILSPSGNLLLSAYLNYEESLQAAAVREAVGRIRRAAARVLKPDSLKSVVGQTLVHMNTGIRERLVLMPVARQFETPATPLREVKMGQKGLLCCGDNFTFSLVPWINIAQSVQDVVTILSKE
jgi:hypothetical protein